MNKLCVAIGVASEKQTGWLQFSQAELDATNADDWARHFQYNSIDNIIAEHVWEHLSWSQAHAASRLCFQYLKPGGCLRLAVPDIFHVSSYIRDVISATGSKANEHNHLVDYNYKLMNRLLTEEKFKVQLQDWWDETGVFHTHYTGHDNNGYVMRSYKNWPKHQSIYREDKIYKKIINTIPDDQKDVFIKKKIEHTSLIVDAIKPLL